MSVIRTVQFAERRQGEIGPPPGRGVKAPASAKADVEQLPPGSLPPPRQSSTLPASRKRSVAEKGGSRRPSRREPAAEMLKPQQALADRRIAHDVRGEEGLGIRSAEREPPIWAERRKKAAKK